MNIGGIEARFDTSQFKIKDIEMEQDKSKELSFQELLDGSLNAVNSLQIDAMNKNTMLATGEIENIHDVTIAAEKAQIAMDLTLAVRNKAVDTYREMMRMQI